MAHATKLLTKTLLMYGEGRERDALFHAADKKTGKHIGTVEFPAETNQPPMTYMHEGKQYVVLPAGPAGIPGISRGARSPRRRR